MRNAECQDPEALREVRRPKTSARDKASVVSSTRDAFQINHNYDDRRSSYRSATHTYFAIILAVMLLCMVIQTTCTMDLVNDVKRQSRDIRRMAEIKNDEHVRDFIGHEGHPPPRHNVTQNRFLPTYLPTAPYNYIE